MEKTVNDLYNDPEGSLSDLEGSLGAIGTLVHTVMSRAPNIAFYSKRIPDMPDGNLIAFLRGGTKLIFYVERESGSYAKEIPKDAIHDFIFTPVVFDLATGGPINTEDL